MKRVCAWCKKDLKPTDEFASDGEITHGICTQCAISVSSFEPRSLQKLLNYVLEPVFVIDADGIMKAANQSGLNMLGKDPAEIENELGGDAFECSYAGIDGGCGNTVHCKTCAIRNIVMDTLSTGEGLKNVPAFQSISTSNGARIIKFHISTEKVEERILLRIDKVIDNGEDETAAGLKKKAGQLGNT